MSTHYWLYRAPTDAGTPNGWNGDNFERLGAPDPIKRAISLIIPECHWGIVGNRWVSTSDQAPQVELETLDENAEHVVYIRILYAELSVIRAITRALDLKVFDTETCELVQT